MPGASDSTPQGGLGRFLSRAVTAGFVGIVALVFWPVTITVVAASAVPLVGLVGLSRPRTSREHGYVIAAVAVAAWWLLTPAELPGNAFRAVTLVAAATFVCVTFLTGLRTIHRILAAVATAVATVSVMLVALGTSWGEVGWWVRHRLGPATRKIAGAFWIGGDNTPMLRGSDAEQMQRWLESTVRLAGDFFPALITLAVSAGLIVAVKAYWRVSPHPYGRAVGRLAEFRFSEHLGWGVVAALVIVLIPKLVAAKTAALNVLLVAAVLYGLRGVAVGAYFLEAVGGASVLLSFVLAAIMFLMLPVVLGSAILLGVLDTGLDLRMRWKRPRASD